MTMLVRAGVLTKFFDVAHSLKLQPHPVLRKVKLSRALLEDPNQHISQKASVALLEEAAAAAHCPTFGLRMAELRDLSDFGVVSLLISRQPTVRAALTTIIRYRHILNEASAMQIEDAGNMVVVRHDLVIDRPAPQATELAIGVLFRMCRALLGGKWHPYSVNFIHGAPDDLSVHRRVFGCKVEFGSEFNGFVCKASELDAPNPLADPAMARFAEQFIESIPSVSARSVALDVRKAIYTMLPTGKASIAYIAQSLGLGVHTLQRRLADEGESFTDLLHTVRCDLAERYIDNPQYSLARISELLGYGSPTSFTRWFISRFGVAPNVWRQRRRQRVRRKAPPGPGQS